MGLAFLYFGYVRGIGFKFQILEPEQGVYEALYQDYPQLNTIAFIALAFLFLVGGSVLLSVGMREWRKWFSLRAEKRQLRRLQETEQETDSRLQKVGRQFNDAEALATCLEDGKRFGEVLEDQVEFLWRVYDANYARGLREMLTDVDNGQWVDGKYHLVTRKILANTVINSVIRWENQNGR